MAKFVVKLALGTRGVVNKVEFGRNVVLAMTGNTNFTTPSPALTAITTATDDLEAAFLAAKTGGTLQTSLMYEKEAEWDVLMTALGNYVDNIARYSESIILSAAMQTKRLNTPVGVPVRVANVKVTSVRSGELSIKWKAVYGAKAYLGYVKLDGEAADQYKLLIKVTRARATVSGLESGKKYAVVIEAVGAGGVGELSNIATSVVL